MAHRKRIPRPRHLFPELAALVTYSQRGLLRVLWWFREERDWNPAWSLGAIAGISGIMLATLLFFLNDSNVTADFDAAPQKLISDIRPIPDPGKFPLEVPTEVLPEFPHLNLPSPNLTFSSLTRTQLDSDWNQNEIATTVSRPATVPFTPDFWSQSLPQAQDIANFKPYSPLVDDPVASLVLPTSKNSISPFDFISSYRKTGLRIEKHLPSDAQIGQPFSYEIHVTNTSTEFIDHVEVREQISAIGRVTAVVPQAQIVGHELIWQLGRLNSGAQEILQITIIPDQNEPISTQAVLTHISQVSTFAVANSPLATEPESTALPEATIVLEEQAEEVLPVLPEPIVETPVQPEHFEPEAVQSHIAETVPSEPRQEPPPFVKLELDSSKVKPLRIGEHLTVSFTVTNIGTAPGEDIVLLVALSDQFGHKHGAYVRHRIDRLAPGDSHDAILRARTVRPGKGSLDVTLQHQDIADETQTIAVEIAARPTGYNSGDSPEQSISDFRPVPLRTRKTAASEVPPEQDGWSPTVHPEISSRPTD